MFRVHALSVLTFGLLIAASAQAQPPGPPPMFQPNGPMPGMMGPGPMQGGMFGGPAPVAQAGFDSPGYGYGPGPVQQAGFLGGACQKGGCCGDCGGGCGSCGGGCGCGPSCIDGCCPPPGHPCVFNAEVEASILFMNLDGNTTQGSMASPNVPVFATFSSADPNLDDDVTLTPRIWLHCQKGCWGVGTRIWYLSDWRSEFTPLNLLQLNIIGDYSTENVRAWNSDLELTYSFHKDSCHHCPHLGGFGVQFGVGVRYANFENQAVSLGAARLDDAIVNTTAVAATEFDGVGITGGIRGTKCLWHNVSLYVNARYSHLFGDVLARSQASASAVNGIDAAADVFSAGARSDEELLIGEFQVGLQWEHELRCIPANCFFRVAGEYQYWDLRSDIFAQSNAQVQIDVLPAGPGQVAIATSESSAIAPQLDLFGLSIAAGLTW